MVIKKAGLPPGEVVYIGKEKTEKVNIEVIDYTESRFQEKSVKNIDECLKLMKKPSVTWINITGIHETEIIKEIGNAFGLHPLMMEDIANPNQRPKVDDYEKQLFIVLKMLNYNKERDAVDSEQVSLVFGQNYVISFQEREGDAFDPVRERIRKGIGKIRKSGADYLVYSLLDIIIDNYFMVLEKLGEKIGRVEERIIKSPAKETLRAVHKLKRELIYLRKSVWPLREVISALVRGEFAFIKKATIVYLRDVYDHTIQVIDTIETFRDMASVMTDVYLSSISNRMNEVMKVLTIIATIFIPLTFVTGIYGMNFRFMPEIEWELGYFSVWLVIILIAVTMLGYFRKKKWI